MNKTAVFLGMIVVSSCAAFLYLNAQRKRRRHDEKNLKKEIRRWEGEGGSVSDFRQAREGKVLSECDSSLPRYIGT